MSVFEVLANDDQQQRIAGTRAVIATQERVKTRFEKFVAKARNDEDRETRLAMVEDQIRAVVAEVAEEYGFDNTEHLYLAGTSVLGGGHKPGCTCGFCKNMGNLPGSKKDDGDGDSDDEKTADDSDDDDDSDDKEESKKPWEKDSGTQEDAEAEEHRRQLIQDEDDKKKGAPTTPLGKDEYPWLDDKESSTNCDCTCENCKSGAHCSNAICVETKHSGHPGNGEVSKEAAANAIWHTAADPATGDTFVLERESLPTSTNGLGSEGSPQIDKSRVPANGLKPIDVPSKQHPVVQQAMHETPDYGKELPGPSATGTSVDAGKAMQPEINVADNTKTWTGTEGFADPVTSRRAAKWAVTE